jgi:cytochrome c oxidase cbb3-type subunit 3
MTMGSPISTFIVVFTTINILACLWLMWWTSRTRDGEASKTGHVWDGDLEEYNNPMPRWWLGLFVITIVFAGGYLAFYPGLGNFAGLGRWSSTASYEQQVSAQRARFEQYVARFKDRSLRELSRDPAAMATARNLFNANCAACHGSDARGARGFPNLTDRDWLWGGSEAQILETITNGRHGIMPALGDALGGARGVDDVAAYVQSLSGKRPVYGSLAAGKAQFETLCVACHGADAHGNTLLGAPNLTDDVWLHGGDVDAIRATITKGRDNQMPAHGELLGAAKVRLLAAYVLSLGGADDVPAP